MSDEMKERLRRIRESRESPAGEKPKGAASEGTGPGEPGDPAGESVARTRSGTWPEVSLRLKFQQGKQRALPYFLLQDLQFDPDAGLVLEYSHCKVCIEGRNLAPLFDRLADHRVRHVREVDALAAERFAERATVVTKIIVEDQ